MREWVTERESEMTRGYKLKQKNNQKTLKDKLEFSDSCSSTSNQTSELLTVAVKDKQHHDVCVVSSCARITLGEDISHYLSISGVWGM